MHRRSFSAVMEARLTNGSNWNSRAYTCTTSYFCLPIEHNGWGFRWKKSQPRLIDVIGESEGGGVLLLIFLRDGERDEGWKLKWKRPFCLELQKVKKRKSKIHEQEKLLFDNQPALGYHGGKREKKNMNKWEYYCYCCCYKSYS